MYVTLPIIILASSKRPISVTDFPAHVSNMHSNDDYLFSVEYPVREYIEVIE